MTSALNVNAIRVGTVVRGVSARVETTHSAPPPFYTDATLLADMLGAAAYAANEGEAAVLEATNGIGTARTRSEGIMDLIKNGSVLVEDALVSGRRTKILKLSEAGARLEAALPHELKSVGLTAKWEMLCRRIERGEVKAQDFLAVIRKFVTSVVDDVKKRKSLGIRATTPPAASQNNHTVKP